MASMYQDVKAMNDAYGNPAGDKANPNWDKLRAQFKNIFDEYCEGLKALGYSDEVVESLKGHHATTIGEVVHGFAEESLKEFRDASCDINVFSLGGHHIAGYDADADMRMVFESNMSKFCATQEIVDATVAKYAALGVETYVEGEFPLMRVKSSKEQTGSDGEVYRAGKMLKSTSTVKPSFNP